MNVNSHRPTRHEVNRNQPNRELVLGKQSFLCEYMAKLLFVAETFADVSSGALDEVCQGELTCISQIDWTWIFEHPFVRSSARPFH